MKKTALALILVSTFSHAEQFVVIYRTFFGPGDHVSADKLHSYAFSTQPLKENEKILTVDTDGSLLEDAIVMNNIDFATFVKEISSDGISLDEDNQYYLGGAKNISGWKYIYRVNGYVDKARLLDGGEVFFPEVPYLGLQTDRFKEGDKIPNKGVLLPSMRYSITYSPYLIKHLKSSGDSCPKKLGVTTVEWGSYKLSYKEFCGVVNH